MHILLGILGAVVAAAFFIYRIQIAIRAGREVADEVGDPRRFVRKFRWARKVKGNPLDGVDDPREAATVLMLALARTDGDLAEPARTAILGQMTRHFGMAEGAADAMLRQIAWMTRDMTDVTPRMRKLVTVLQRHCTPSELEDAATMLDEVSRACGGLTPMRLQIIQRYRHILREQDSPASAP